MANENKKEWYYLDKSEVEQGPFSLVDMRGWWRGGFFPTDLQIRLHREYKYRLLVRREDYILFKDPNEPDLEVQSKEEEEAEAAATSAREEELRKQLEPMANPFSYQEYSISGRFNTRTGKWESKEWDKPTDRSMRQMSHYFDVDLYQRIRSGEEKYQAPAPTKAKTKKKKAADEDDGDEDKDSLHHPYKKDKNEKKKRLVV